MKTNENYVKEIITDYDVLVERLDEKPVHKNRNDMRECVLKLKHTLSANKVMSLSAPQIGEKERVFVIDFNGDIRSFCNPMITEASDITLSKETDPCFPDKKFLCVRYGKITLNYTTPLGEVQSVKLVGLAAYLAQLQMDHLEGIILPDLALEIDEDFENATDEEKSEIVQMYLESLDIKEKEMKEQVYNDPDAKELADAINFVTSVKSGETEIEPVYEPIENEEENGT